MTGPSFHLGCFAIAHLALTPSHPSSSPSSPCIARLLASGNCPTQYSCAMSCRLGKPPSPFFFCPALFRHADFCDDMSTLQ
ncbi:hypothetical protein LY78DRAFT_661104 [Colletotrichum sublineola]|nr:hypothetical protein LY78DRAFT_661104 [Colletotrichum sublineola]